MANLAEDLYESLSTGLSERGNTSLLNYETGDVTFFHQVAIGVWLEIVHLAENYPSWTIQTVNKTKHEIKTHIEENFSDPWVMRKNNIGANTHKDGSPITMEEVIDAIEGELYNNNKRMNSRKEIRTALNGILSSFDWTISENDSDKILDEYYNTL